MLVVNLASTLGEIQRVVRTTCGCCDTDAGLLDQMLSAFRFSLRNRHAAVKRAGVG